MDKRKNVIVNLCILRTWCAVNPDYGMGLDVEQCEKAVGWLDDAIGMMQAEGEGETTSSVTADAVPPSPEGEGEGEAAGARVMKMDEALGGDECWVEYSNGGCGYADCYMSYTTNGADIYRTMQHDFNVPLANYGKTWRCWTSRPTDEQREAVKWE